VGKVGAPEIIEERRTAHPLRELFRRLGGEERTTDLTDRRKNILEYGRREEDDSFVRKGGKNQSPNTVAKKKGKFHAIEPEGEISLKKKRGRFSIAN